MDFGKKQVKNYTPLNINRSTVERVDNFKYLGVHITEGLTWVLHTDSAVRKASTSCTIESVLTGNITAWYGNNTEPDRKALQRVVNLAERIIGSTLPCIKDIYTRQCKTKAENH